MRSWIVFFSSAVNSFSVVSAARERVGVGIRIGPAPAQFLQLENHMAVLIDA